MNKITSYYTVNHVILHDRGVGQFFSYFTFVNESRQNYEKIRNIFFKRYSNSDNAVLNVIAIDVFKVWDEKM